MKDTKEDVMSGDVSKMDTGLLLAEARLELNAIGQTYPQLDLGALHEALARLAAAQVVPQPNRDALKARLAEALRDVAYSCDRVWEAWQYGTMTQDDFSPAWEDEELLDDLADAALSPAPLSIDRREWTAEYGAERDRLISAWESVQGDPEYGGTFADWMWDGAVRWAAYLSAQPVAGQVEWGVRVDVEDGQTIEWLGSRELADKRVFELRRNFPFPEEIALVSRTVGPWIEVQP